MDMTQAVLEGVAFALRDSFEVAKTLGIPIERTKICGGGAKSPLWKKIIANVLNIKVDVLETEEGPSLGGAMLAAVACGEYKDVESAAAAIVKVVLLQNMRHATSSLKIFIRHAKICLTRSSDGQERVLFLTVLNSNSRIPEKICLCRKENLQGK